MEQSPKAMSRPKESKLAVLSFILSLFPILGGLPLAVLVSRDAIPLNSCLIWVTCVSLAGITLSVLTHFLIKKRGHKLSAYGIAFGVVLLIFYMKAVPNFMAMRTRAMDAQVKAVARELQLAVEAFQQQKKNSPARVADVEHLLPLTVRDKKNPFNPKETYTTTGGGLVDGRPTSVGQVGYIAPQSQSESYLILTYPKLERNTFRLTEVNPESPADSGRTPKP